MRAQKCATTQPLIPVPERYKSHTIYQRHLKRQDVQRIPRLTELAFYPYAHKLLTTTFTPEKCRRLHFTTKLVLSVVTSIKILEEQDTTYF